MESHGIIKKEGITNTSTLMSLLANPNASQAKAYSTEANNFIFSSNSINHNRINIMEEIVEDNKSKKTNSTGDITPCKSPSMTQDLIDQFLLNENFLNIPAVNESNFNINNNINNVVNQLNKIKVNQYILREREMLDTNNKLSFGKKKFKVMKTNINLIRDNVEKYFPLPKKSKDKERKMKMNDYYSDKNFCKEP